MLKHRRPGVHPVPQRRALPDPPAVADRRAVHRVRADAAARARASRPPPELPKIDVGDGAGQYLLPVDNTTTPVARRPAQRHHAPAPAAAAAADHQRARCRPGGQRRRRCARPCGAPTRRCRELDEVIADPRRPEPAARQAHRRVRRGARALGRAPEEFAGFIDEAGATAAATAERGDDLERNFERFPRFLRELPADRRALGVSPTSSTPASRALGRNAPAINETIAAARPVLQGGHAGGQVARRLRATAAARCSRRSGRWSRDAQRAQHAARSPAAKTSAELFGSFDDTGGIEELMRLIYFYTGAVNGVDEHRALPPRSSLQHCALPRSADRSPRRRLRSDVPARRRRGSAAPRGARPRRGRRLDYLLGIRGGHSEPRGAPAVACSRAARC